MDRKIVFIHSAGWRTGSTYLWNKFRKQPDVRAFYEPFNHILEHITENDISTIEVPVNHPDDIDKPYFYEYGNLLRDGGGVEYFNGELSYHNFFSNDEMINADAKAYINNLIERSGPEKVLVLAFNRSIGRMRWFKENYGGIHIFQYRNPYDQWISIKKGNIMATSEGLAYETHIYSLNSESHIYNPLKSHPIQFVNKDQMNYFHMMYLHRVFKRIGFKYSDLIINMNELSSSNKKKKKLNEKIRKLTGMDIDFSDLSIREYSSEEHSQLCYPAMSSVIDSYFSKLKEL